MISHRGILRRTALVALAAPLFAACSVSDQTMGIRGDVSGGAMFDRYVALGTSIGAGFQSGGINDSTQRQSYAYLLAERMGFHPGLDWFYPAFAMPGCPAPYTNPLTGARVGPPAAPCYLRTPASAAPAMNNLSIPGIRAKQVLNLQDLSFAKTDTLQLAQFITGGRNPMDVAESEHPTFVTLETFANDVLGAATHGDTTLLTPMASFQATLNAMAARLDSMGAKVLVLNVPNVTVIPHFSAGMFFYCLHNHGCPAPLPDSAYPYSLPSFTVSATCAPSAFGGGAVGDSMLVAFPVTATITGTLAGGGAASLDCGAGTATSTDLSGVHQLGPVLTKAVTLTIAGRVLQMNGAIAQMASTHDYALVDLNALLGAMVAAHEIRPFPNFADPAHLFGSLVPGHPDLISYDGIHPTVAAHTLIADSLASVINTKWSTHLATQ